MTTLVKVIEVRYNKAVAVSKDAIRLKKEGTQRVTGAAAPSSAARSLRCNDTSASGSQSKNMPCARRKSLYRSAGPYRYTCPLSQLNLRSCVPVTTQLVPWSYTL